MNPFPKYNEKGELDTRLRVDPVTGDVGIGTPKEKKYMTKDEAVILLCEHFSEGMVRTIVDAIAKDEALEKKDEPVALVAEVHISRYTIEWTNGPLPQGTKLYTTPQRKPLTDEHIDEIPFALFEQDQNGISATEALREFARAIEAAHGIKE